MNEVNKRWKRDHNHLKLLVGYGGLITPGFWAASYLTSLSAASSGQGIWFTWVSGFTLAASIVLTVATVIGVGMAMVDDPPFEGSNR